jgi:ubiquinone/menaquinone biosynthesis C-methylase UbiE
MKQHLFDALLAVLLIGTALLAQDKSVKPGINDRFKNNPDPEEFAKRFEGESREIFVARKKILETCKLKPGMAVADIGAGTGLFTRLFAPAVGPKGKVYAVDIAPNFLAYIKKTCEKAKIDNVETVKCSDRSCELKEGSVDLVFVCDTYHHFEFPNDTLATIHKALRPGGQLIVIDFHRIPGKSREWILGHVRAGQEVVEKEITSAGFKKLDEQKVPGLKENYFLRFEKAKARQR